MTRFLVGFTGTREGMTADQKATVRELLVDLLATEGEHGDCVGADADFHDVCRALGLKVSCRPCTLEDQRAWTNADQRDDPRPPLERNGSIVADSNAVIACPAKFEEELRSGTWSAVRYARKAGKPLFIVWPDGKLTSELS
jgi:hypothetical protein